MKHIWLIILGLFISSASFSQNYDIKTESQRVNSNKYEGFSSKVDGPYLKVEEYWIDYIKDHGKARRRRNYYELTEFSVSDMGVDTVSYVTRVESVDSLGLIWIAPISESLSTEDITTLNADLERILKLATRGFYVNEVQEKIDQSEAAAIAVSKSHQKLIYEGEKLHTDSISTENLKLELEQRLEETILKLKVLSQQIIDNKVSVNETYKDLERIKEVIESHKANLKKIN